MSMNYILKTDLNKIKNSHFHRLEIFTLLVCQLSSNWYIESRNPNRNQRKIWKKNRQTGSKIIWGLKGSRIAKTKHSLRWLSYQRMIMPFFIQSQGELDILIVSSNT